MVAVETAVYADEEERVAMVSSAGLAGEFEATTAYAYLQAIAEADGDKQTGLGFGMGRSPEALDAEEIGREAAARATSLLGAPSPASRTCPVVLDPIVAASFVGFIGGTLCADAVQRGRSPFAGPPRRGRRRGAPSRCDDATDPAGLNSSPFDAEGSPRGRTPLIEAGRLAAYLHDSYTARREGGEARSTANASRAGYRSPPSVSTSNLVVDPGSKSFEGLLARAGDGVYVTDVGGPSLGRQPRLGHLLGRRYGSPDRGRPARRPRRRVHDRLRPAVDAEGGDRRRLRSALGPLRRLGEDPGAVDRRDGDRRRLAQRSTRTLKPP